MKRIGIIGCGWLGTKLADRLKSNYKVHATCRTPQRAAQITAFVDSTTIVDFSSTNFEQSKQWHVVPSLDVLVIMVPFSLRNSSEAENIYKMKNVCTFIGDFDGQLFYTSSTGVYSKAPKRYREEDLPVDANPIEHLLKNHYQQVTILRLAGLMGADRLLKNYTPRDLESPVNHIHYYDACSVIIEMMQKGTHGELYNVVAPLHPSKKEVLAAQIEGIVQDTAPPPGRVILSDKLEGTGFSFKYPDPRTFH